MYHFFQTIAYIPLNILYPVKIIGKKNLPKGKAILSPNHTSNTDIALLIGNLFEKKYTLAKQELFKNKFKGGFLKIMGGIPVDRENPSISSMKKILSLLKKNKKVIIFPEGTRNGDIAQSGEIGETKNGIVLFAVKSKAPIIPIWISRKPRAFRKTKIIIGKPYELSDYYGKKLDEKTLKEAGKIVNSKLLELGKKCINGEIWFKRNR